LPNKKRSLLAASLAVATAAIVTAALFGTSVASASSTAGKKCLHPKKSVVTVKEFEYGFTLSPRIAQCGTVTFKQSNTGALPHNFDLQGVKAGKLINPHATSSFTVTLTPKKYNYLCDVLGHASLGMVGTLTVKD
jgi:uncharacterized cupredoxin-like copper-binding protein